MSRGRAQQHRPLDPIAEGVAKGKFVGAGKTRRPKPSKRKSHNRIRAPPATATGAFSIPQFCEAHGGMSAALYYKLQKQNKGPKEMKVGSRTLISVEAAREWRETREAEASAEAEGAMMDSIRKTLLPDQQTTVVTVKRDGPDLLCPFVTFLLNDGGKASSVETYATEVAALLAHDAIINNANKKGAA